MLDEERRDGNRLLFPEQCSISYDAKSSPQTVMIHDLSVGGVALISAISLPDDEAVEISFGSGDDCKVMKGIVQHSKAMDGGKYQIGVRFLEDEDQESH